jgi:class 3 adenylate cyclase
VVLSADSTVLFANMVGFTSFSERSGEEAAYSLMRVCRS